MQALSLYIIGAQIGPLRAALDLAPTAGNASLKQSFEIEQQTNRRAQKISSFESAVL